MQRKLRQRPAGLKEYVYYTQGTHCASCEILIEKKLLELNNIEAVEASVSKAQVFIEYRGERPAVEELNKLFKEESYRFSDRPFSEKETGKDQSLAGALMIAFGIIIVFLSLNRFGLGGLANVNSSSSLPAFFVLGVVAGISTCAALVGGMVLSMSKQWSELYRTNDSLLTKLQPHFLFNAGRLASYAVLGAALGLIGQKLQFSLTFTSFSVLGVSLLMITIALRLLGFKSFQKFQPTLPKFVTRYVANERNFQGRYLPVLMGAGTFFLPCGFTLTAQSLALLSGNPLRASLIMLAFALGTVPTLLFIGISSSSFSRTPIMADQFSKVAGILILFFALFNINAQFNVLGWPSFNNIKLNPGTGSGSVNSVSGLVPTVNGKQLMQMDASSSGYTPNYFKVRVGLPVRWEINDKGTSGCTNAVISRSLFDGEVDLTPGQTSVKEFTPTKTGKYKFSCWMGMISGVIEVVDNSDSPVALGVSNNDPINPSGAKGCGCGGAGGQNY